MTTIPKDHLDELPYLCHLCSDGTAFYDRLSKKVHLHLSHAVPYTHPPGGPIAIDSYKKAVSVISDHRSLGRNVVHWVLCL